MGDDRMTVNDDEAGHRAWAVVGESGGDWWIEAVYKWDGDARKKADLLDGTAPAGTNYWVCKTWFVIRED